MKLKPCPFCGGEAELWDNKLERRLYGVICKECDCMTPYFESEVEAIEAWNRREPIDEIVEQLKEIQMGEYSAKAEYVQGMNGNSIAYCDGAINTIEKAIEIVKGGAE